MTFPCKKAVANAVYPWREYQFKQRLACGCSYTYLKAHGRERVGPWPEIGTNYTLDPYGGANMQRSLMKPSYTTGLGRAPYAEAAMCNAVRP